MVNARLEWEFGYEHDELIGQHVEVLVPESLRLIEAPSRSGYLTQAETDTHVTDAGVKPCALIGKADSSRRPSAPLPS